MLRLEWVLRSGGFDGPVVSSSGTNGPLEFVVGETSINAALVEMARTMAVDTTRLAAVPAALDLNLSGVKSTPTYLELTLREALVPKMARARPASDSIEYIYQHASGR